MSPKIFAVVFYRYSNLGWHRPIAKTTKSATSVACWTDSPSCHYTKSTTACSILKTTFQTCPDWTI